MKRSPFIIFWLIMLQCIHYAQPADKTNTTGQQSTSQKEKYDSPRFTALVKSGSSRDAELGITRYVG